MNLAQPVSPGKMDWNSYKTAFAPDGFARHICVPGVSLSDWNTYYRMLRKTKAKLHFYKDGEPEPLPERIGDLPFRSIHRYMFVVDLADFKVFWRLEQMERMRFEFFPEAVKSVAQAVLVFRIMSTLGRRLDKEVILMHPQDGRTLFRYAAGNGDIKYLG